jgi:hypothetical protein
MDSPQGEPKSCPSGWPDESSPLSSGYHTRLAADQDEQNVISRD